MIALGVLLVIIGVGSFVLPMIGYPIGPYAGFQPSVGDSHRGRRTDHGALRLSSPHRPPRGSSIRRN